MSFVIVPVAGVNADSVGIPHFTEALSFVIEERTGVAASVGIIHDAAAVTKSGEGAVTHVTIVTLVCL